jgi:hypothetical protein
MVVEYECNTILQDSEKLIIQNWNSRARVVKERSERPQVDAP